MGETDWGGKLSLVLMGRAMLSKLMVRAVFSPCCLTWGQPMVESMNLMVTSFRRFCASPAVLSAPDPAAGHCRPHLHRRLLDAHGHIWVSLLWDHCPFLLGPGVHKVLFVRSKSLFPQSCVRSGGSIAGRSNLSILKEISPEYSLEGLMLKLKLQYFGHLMWITDSFEKTLMLGKTEGRRRREDKGWNDWMTSPTQWTWVWVGSGSWCWTGKPGVLQSMVSQRVGHNWATELTD